MLARGDDALLEVLGEQRGVPRHQVDLGLVAGHAAVEVVVGQARGHREVLGEQAGEQRVVVVAEAVELVVAVQQTLGDQQVGGVDRGHGRECGGVPVRLVNAELLDHVAGTGVLGHEGVALGAEGVDRERDDLLVVVGEVDPVELERIDEDVAVVGRDRARGAQEEGADVHVVLGGDARQADRDARLIALVAQHDRVDLRGLGVVGQLERDEEVTLLDVLLEDRDRVGVLLVAVVAEPLHQRVDVVVLQDDDVEGADGVLEEHVGAGILTPGVALAAGGRAGTTRIGAGVLRRAVGVLAAGLLRGLEPVERHGAV